MEELRGPHWSDIIRGKECSSEDRKNTTVKSITYSGNLKYKPINIALHDKACWINKSELELLQEAKVDLDKVKMVWYVLGSTSPFGTANTNAASTINGYEVHVLI